MLPLKAVIAVLASALALTQPHQSASGGPTPPTPPTQSGGVTVYDGLQFRGRSAVLSQSWAGGGYWDRRIRSVRVPSGYRMTLYTEPNYRGTETRLTSSWAPASATAYWVGKARSFRLDRVAVQPVPPTPPVGSSGGLTLYTQGGYRGRVLGPTGDWPGTTNDGSPFARIGSMRVPAGWRVVAFALPNYQGPSLTHTADWAGGPIPIRSLRVQRPQIQQPR